MRKFTRIAAMLMAVMVLFASSGFEVLAEEAVSAEQGNVVTEEEGQAGEGTDGTAKETTVNEPDSSQPTTETTPSQTETLPSETETVPPEAVNTPSEDVLSYVYVDEKVVNVPETQNIAIGFSDEKLVLESAVLKYTSVNTAESYEMTASNILNNTVLFTKEYNEGPIEDQFKLESITYKVSGHAQESTLVFSDVEIEAGYVVTMAPAEEEKAAETTPEVTVYTVDESGNTVEETGDANTVETAVESALQKTGDETVTQSAGEENASPVMRSARTNAAATSARSGNLVVVICAGHDSSHPGASGGGFREHELTYKVAQYCKAELEQYAGVTVYLDRNSISCAYPGQSSNYCLNQRVHDAKAKGADVFVDIHFNTGGGTGAEVYYPNKSYNQGVSNEGHDLANKILDQLSALGLRNRGAKIKDTTLTTDNTDSAGNLDDYYTTNYLCKQYGFPGIIVEHAFLDNANDAAKLRDENFLRQLGVADATGIANTYGLTKDRPKVEIINKNDFTGTFTVRASGVNPRSGNQVLAYVWGTGQNSTGTPYILKNQGGNVYTATVNKSKHSNFTGNYYVALYYATSSGSPVQPELASTNTTLYNSVFAMTLNANSGNQFSYTLTSQITNPPRELKSVQYAVWPSGQAAKWYTAAKNSNTYTSTVNLSDFKSYGTYYVDTYVEYTDGRMLCMSSKNFSVAKPSMSGVNVANANSENGTFDVIIKGVNVPTGMKSLQVAAWPAGTAAKWYNAVAQSDGTYKISVNVSDFAYVIGRYYMDVYVTDNWGVTSYLGGTNYTMTFATAQMSATDVSGKQQQYQLKVSNAVAVSGVKGVRIAVWRAGNSPKWYDATASANGEWIVNVNISAFNLTGRYYADAYVITNNSGIKYCCGTNFQVDGAKADSVSITNQNNENGTYEVVISGVYSPSGVKKIQVPSWKAGEPATWYAVADQGNGMYKATVNIKNHNYMYGRYYSDVYLTDGNDAVHYLGGTNCELTAPKATVSVADITGAQKQFQLSAKNVSSTLGVKNVQFAVWRSGGAVKWYNADQASDGAWNRTVNISDFKLTGTYYADVYVNTSKGTMQYVGGTAFRVDAPKIQSVSYENINYDTRTFTVRISGVTPAASGIETVRLAIWPAGKPVVWCDAQNIGNGVYEVGVDARTFGYVSGVYYSDIYIKDGNQSLTYVGGTNKAFNFALNTIMGTTSVSVRQMVNYYKANSPIAYPSVALGKGGAGTLEEFCQMYYDEARAEGVKAEVAFAQAMLETGFLKYGGDVKIEQFNFAGLGATGGVPGNSFVNVRIGIRAQIQHLKCYASDQPLNQALVDQRWSNNLRNKAPYVEWLSIPNNPFGTGWASDANYGTKLVAMMGALKKM